MRTMYYGLTPKICQLDDINSLNVWKSNHPCQALYILYDATTVWPTEVYVMRTKLHLLVYNFSDSQEINHTYNQNQDFSISYKQQWNQF